MYLGDNFIVGGITGVVDDFRRERPDVRILLTHVCEPTAFGIAELDETGRVVGLEEKPQQPKSDLALVGVYLFTPAVHEAVRSIRPSRRGELEITDALQWLLEQGRDVRSTTISGYWKDTGNVTDMLEVNRSVLETVEPRIDGSVDGTSEIIGRVRIEEGAKVFTSRSRPRPLGGRRAADAAPLVLPPERGVPRAPGRRKTQPVGTTRRVGG